MAPIIVRYNLDPTGVSPDNLVQGEAHTLVGRLVRSIAPIYGAFFAGSMVVTDQTTGLPLVRGQQWYPGELYDVPTALYGKDIFAIVIITDVNVSSSVSLQYQSVGGEYGTSDNAIIQQLATLNVDARPVAWPDIIRKPADYPPSMHLHDAGDVYGFEYVVHALERVRAALEFGDEISHDQIYNYIDTKIATDIGSINNVAVTITTETNARTLADTALQLQITANNSARTTADATLQTELTAETNARTTADASLQAQITAGGSAGSTALATETTARTTADATLQTEITAEVNARTAADIAEANARNTAIAVAISTVTNTLSGEINTMVSNENNIRYAADNVLSANLAAETVRAEAAEAALATMIANQDKAQVLVDAAWIAWDINAGNSARLLLLGSRYIPIPTNLKVGTYVLIIQQNASGNGTVTWAANFKWPASIKPVLSTTPGVEDLFSFYSDGTDMYGSYVRGMG
jgi:hypothetical protein